MDKRYRATLAEAVAAIQAKGISNMTEAELRYYGAAIRDVAQKRLKRIEKNQYFSPAYLSFKKKEIPTSLNVRGIDKKRAINILRHRVYEMYNFVQAQTSTSEGIRQHKAHVSAIIGKENLKDYEYEAILDAFHRLEDAVKNDDKIAGYFIKYGYDEILKTVAEQRPLLADFSSKRMPTKDELYEMALQALRKMSDSDVERSRDAGERHPIKYKKDVLEKNERRNIWQSVSKKVRDIFEI